MNAVFALVNTPPTPRSGSGPALNKINFVPSRRIDRNRIAESAGVSMVKDFLPRRVVTLRCAAFNFAIGIFDAILSL